MNNTTADNDAVKTITELSFICDENLTLAKSLLDVALNSDMKLLQQHTQHDFLSVLDDKLVVAMAAYSKLIKLCNNPHHYQ